ncbi:hypothetical protein FDT66_06890 [Polaribacter aestuariivivens]|uniref:Tetratricopeptide repeat protein n=1 Tax=Polaribacter aestuariivivens TaxID=2304626 RepID=A0A5S3N7F5_9FLAO|nr:hypothetical protein [Polaribacter aestuariivivens]TMM30484.1 hypothetical protein FDT66_06890 [Polaribacter aestuariivivens]
MITDDDIKIVAAHKEYEKGKIKLQQIEKKNNFFFSKKWLIAASVLFLVSLSSLLFLPSEKSADELFASYFEPYTNVIAPISRSYKNKSTLEIAFKNYENKKYAEALEGLEGSITKENKTALHLYIAVTNLELENTNKAIAILEKNLKDTNTWKDKYLWYLSLAYLKEKKTEKAIKTLKTLSKEVNNFKKLETLSLLKKLE